jgi:hypothetical protein
VGWQQRPSWVLQNSYLLPLDVRTLSRLIVLVVIGVLSAHGISAWNKQSPERAHAGSSAGMKYLAGNGFDARRSSFSKAKAASFRPFALYAPGERFEDFPLTAILDRFQDRLPGEPHRANYVSFIYGSCAPARGIDGCPAPLEVQVWPSCERSLSDYRLYPDGPALPHIDLTVRGVPAALFDRSRRLELYSGRVTIAIFGFDKDELMRAAARLGGVNRDLAPGQDLPGPAPGALSGALSCASGEGSR